jgi:hypothetical protein
MAIMQKIFGVLALALLRFEKHKSFLNMILTETAKLHLHFQRGEHPKSP